MDKGREKFRTVDEYINTFPPDVRAKLTEMRTAIRNAAPDAVEKISYNMPAFAQNGILVYYAAFKKHIGFYPTASGIAAFLNELSAYKASKGAVQFPLEKPLPLDLVDRMVRFKVRENLKKPVK